MKTDVPHKISIKVATQEQQENAKNTRKTLKILQEAANDKENLAGRSRMQKDSKSLIVDAKDVQKKNVADKAIQTGGGIVTAEDLMSDEPCADYWKLLAEKRQESLDDSMQEIERLKEHVGALEEENRICKEMIEESKHLVEVLQEMVGVQDTSTEIAEEVTEH